MQLSPLQQGMLVRLGDVPVEDHLVPVRGGVLAQLVLPPAGADHVQHGAVHPRHRVDRLLDALVRHQTGEGDQVQPLVVVKHRRMRRNRVDPIFHDRDVRLAHPERHQVALRGLRHRHVLRAPVHPRRHLRFKEPTKPPDQRARHRPLLLVAVVRQQHHGFAREQPREKGDAVLRVHHHIRPVSPDRQRRRKVHAELAAGTLVAHPVPARTPWRVRVFCGAVNNLVALRRQVLPDALEVALRPAALRVGGVAPAQKQYLHGAMTSSPTSRAASASRMS